MGGSGPVGKCVVRREVAGCGAALSHEGCQLLRGRLGDVLVEPSRGRAGGEDPLDRAVLEGTVLTSVVHRREDVVGLVAFAKGQDLTRVIRRRARLCAFECHQERVAAVAEFAVRDAKLIEAGPAVRFGAMPWRHHVFAGATRAEVVPRDQREVLGVHEDLVLRDPDGQELGDVLDRQGVPITLPRDEALEIAHPIRHARGVVGVAGPGDQVRLVLGMELDRRPALLPALRALVVDACHPARELRLEVLEVVEVAPVAEADP